MPSSTNQHLQVMTYPHEKLELNHKAEVEQVEELLAQTTATAGGLGDAIAYFLECPGKRVRVRLCLDLARNLSLPNEQGVVLAAAVELLHGASLVFDDVQDNDAMRRDRPAIWRKFGRDSAISLGTYLISQSFILSDRLPAVGILFARALRDATIGQSAESDFRAQIPSFAAYIAMAEQKTGALFALPAQAAAVLADLPENLIPKIGSMFAHLGAAYQIQDDLADAFGLKGRSRAGLDLREGKANSIMVMHLALVPTERAPFLALLRNQVARNCDAKIDEWQDRLFASGAVITAQQRLKQLCDGLITGSGALPGPFAACLSALAADISDPGMIQVVRGEVFPQCAI